MKLQHHQISEIRNYLIENGLNIPDVLDDLADHISCIVEREMEEGKTFETSFLSTKQLINPEDVRQIQADTNYFITIKSKIMLVKSIFITAFLSVFVYMLGSIVYNLLAFSGVAIGTAGMVRFALQTVGLIICAFGFLPLLFRFGYKRFIARLES